MAKTRAEIQKSYRERLKAKNNEEYLKKERERRRKNYVPSSQLTRRERIRRNVKLNEAVKRHRRRKKEAIAELLQQNVPEVESTSGYDSLDTQTADPRSPDHSSPRLVVQMAFPNRRNGPRKRVAKALANKSREVSTLKQELEKLKTKHKTTQRRLLRLRRKISSSQQGPSTPRSKTEAQINSARLDKHQANTVRKHLLLSNVVMDEVRSAKEQNNPGRAKILHNVVAGAIVRKYRCANLLSKWTGLSRNKLNAAGKSKSKTLLCSKQQRMREVMKFKNSVINFLSRDDNSRNMPGKADKVKTGLGQSAQKRVLTDYMSNLHKKYLSENPTIKLSLASFQRIRPKHILTTSFITRDCCLCTKHQNMALVLKAICQIGIAVPLNPETYVDDPPIDLVREGIDTNEFTFDEWKRVSVEDKGKIKMVMRVVHVTKTKEEFLAHLEKQTAEFSDHVSRMKVQYQQIRLLKEKLPVNHAVIHMDFAENYNCKSVEEIQSAYWNQTGVTLHPTVIYTRPTEESELQHQSFVIISDDQNHNSTSVVTFIKEIVKDVKLLDPEIKCIHYWTDSPTSQYRNKTMFHLVANHQETFGIDAKWNFFEAGHGKGPCDGLGGSTKRLADQAVKSGKVIIQDANDFFCWTQSAHCSTKQVKFRFVLKEHCQQTEKEIALWNAKPVKGTMKVHAVVGQGSNSILVGNVSCYCSDCLAGSNCLSWRKESTKPKETLPTPLFDKETQFDINQNDVTEGRQPVESETEEPAVTVAVTNSVIQADCSYEIDQYVVALYDGRWYIAKITDKDEDDEFPYQISFMEKKKKMFAWPKT